MIEHVDDQSSNCQKFSIIDKNYILSHSSNSIYKGMDMKINLRFHLILEKVKYYFKS